MASSQPAYIDTDVIIRFLTGDDPVKQAAAAALFQSVAAGQLTIATPATAIADAVFVLASPRLYRLPRAQVAALLTPLVRLGGFRVQHKRVVLRALTLYGRYSIDFGDAMITAAMQVANAPHLYSYDRDFDRIPGVVRVEP